MHIEQYFHHVNWFGFCLARPVWRVYIGCLHSGAEEETDHKHTALVCDCKSTAELAAYL